MTAILLMAATPTPAVDPVVETMTRMRIASAVVESMRREAGVYPGADGALRRLRDVVPTTASTTGPNAWIDAWREPLWYRALPERFEIVSYGADRMGEADYETEPLYDPSYRPIADAKEEGADLVIVGSRFLKRPFGAWRAEFETINAINAIFIAASSYAVDNNVYPGATSQFIPVADLESALVPTYLPTLPRLDGWGNPLVYLGGGSYFALASGGRNGALDRVYAHGLPCGQGQFFEPSLLEAGGDIVQECGRFIRSPRGVEP